MTDRDSETQKRPGDRGNEYPYKEFEADPLWPLIERGIEDLVANQDLIEQTKRNYIVGYLCKIVLKGSKTARKGLRKQTKEV